MVNRFGDGIAPPPVAADPTRIWIAQLMLKKPNLDFECAPDGNIQFRLPLIGSAMSPSNLSNARLLRTHWFADSIGGYLVRTNLDKLDDVVCRSDFRELATQRQHTGFGLWVSPRYLQFQFHCELLNKIFNENMRRDLRGVQA